MTSMTIKELTLQEIRYIYHRRMVNDFPGNELKSLSAIERAIRKGIYRCFGLMDADEILAYAFFVYLPENGVDFSLGGIIRFAQGIGGTGGGGLDDAPNDGKVYGRSNGARVEVTSSSPGEEDPFDNVVDPGNYSADLLIIG